MKLSIAKFFDEKNRIPIQGLDDVIIPFANSLLRLGHEVSYIENNLSPDKCNIIFGAHMMQTCLDKINKTDIIFNLEQYHSNSNFFTQGYLDLLRHCRVFEYSKRNAKYLLHEHGIETEFFRIGYDPLQSILDPDFPQDIDVLFYGAINPRRAKIINTLRRRGINVTTLGGVFGKARDLAIARSKIILNIQYYEESSLEIVRLSYLFANRKAVVSECAKKTYFYPELKDACRFSAYEELPEAVEELLANQDKRREIADSSFAAFAQWEMDDTVRALFDSASSSFATSAPCPKLLNAGSGKDFKIDHLNVDISKIWGPDIILDLGQPIDSYTKFDTARFGRISIQPDSFERIIANDVLEHVPDLITMMTNFLTLLKEGGELHLQVPYDLSYGAWQDPTHVRAFNEKSWLYYTEWAWYIGWDAHRFEMLKLEFCSEPENPLGELLQDRDSVRLPRIVDSMKVILRKRKSTAEERMAYAQNHGMMYLHNRHP